MDKRIEERLDALKTSEKMYEGILAEEKMKNSPSRQEIEYELRATKEKINILMSLEDSEVDEYLKAEAVREKATEFFKRNEFIVDFGTPDIPYWTVSYFSMDGNELHIGFNECTLFYAAEYFQNNGKKFKKFDLHVHYLNSIGVKIAEIVIKDVKFDGVCPDVCLNYKDDSVLSTLVKFKMKKNSVTYASAAC